MSKPWNPRPQLTLVGAPRRPRRPRPRWGVHASELHLMLLGGIALGLGSVYYRETGAAGSRPPHGPAAATGAAVRVIDGDTFDYAGMRIRIADIDTPEVDGRCAYETALAARATDRLDALLGEGPFELAPSPDGRDEDRYGRKLRVVMREGESVGGMLVAEGLAREWTGQREGWCG